MREFGSQSTTLCICLHFNGQWLRRCIWAAYALSKGNTYSYRCRMLFQYVAGFPHQGSNVGQVDIGSAAQQSVCKGPVLRLEGASHRAAPWQEAGPIQRQGSLQPPAELSEPTSVCTSCIDTVWVVLAAQNHISATCRILGCVSPQGCSCCLVAAAPPQAAEVGRWASQRQVSLWAAAAATDQPAAPGLAHLSVLQRELALGRLLAPLLAAAALVCLAQEQAPAQEELFIIILHFTTVTGVAKRIAGRPTRNAPEYFISR